MNVRETITFAAAFASALRSQWHNPRTQQKRQDSALVAQLRHAASRVPFYRKSWAETGVKLDAVRSAQDLSKLPIIRRRQIQDQPEAFLAEDGDRQCWRKSRTSGSTGQPLVTWFDQACWLKAKYALKARRLLACGWRPGQRIAIVEALAPGSLLKHATEHSLPGEKRMRWRQYLSVFEHPELHVPALLAQAPHYIYGLPSYFAALEPVWDDQMRRQIPLRALMTSGEWLNPGLRKRLQRTFAVPVLDVYGSTEFKEIAWQCRKGSGYHINMESVIVEIVDEQGKAVAPGEEGEILVTSLTNRAMPLIRYATGDRGRALEGRCPCWRGLERLERIEGRVSDYLRIPERGLVSPYELTTVLEEHPELMQYKVVQVASDRLCIEVVLSPGADDSVLCRIRENVSSHLRSLKEIEVEAVESITSEPSGKYRIFEVRNFTEVGS